jgi:hypothetical protein
MDSLLIIHDPLKPLNKSSHNFDVIEYSCRVAKNMYSRVILGVSVNESSSRCRIVKNFIDIVKILLSTLNVAHKAIFLRGKYHVTIFNPNEDVISLLILVTIRKMFFQKWRIISRFICTRDRRLVEGSGFFETLICKILKMITRPDDKLCAETREHAKKLSQRTSMFIEFVPYPPIDADLGVSNKESSKIKILLPGAAREDKGLDELPSFVEKFQNLDIEVLFFLQKAHNSWVTYPDIIAKLEAMTNLQILPQYLSNEDLTLIINECDILLLPYRSSVYHLRGSGFARRGMYMGKLIIAHDDTSIANDAARSELLAPKVVSEIFKRVKEQSIINYKVGRELAAESNLIWARILK